MTTKIEATDIDFLTVEKEGLLLHFMIHGDDRDRLMELIDGIDKGDYQLIDGIEDEIQIQISVEEDYISITALSSCQNYFSASITIKLEGDEMKEFRDTLATLMK